MTKLLRSTILIGFDPRTALAVARSLHRRGIRVIVGTIAAWEIPIRSRAIEKFVKLPDAQQSSDRFLSVLLSVIENHQVDTLIPITDRALVSLAPHESVLRSKLKVLGPTDSQLTAILDKTATLNLAKRLGIPVPTTVELRDSSTLDEIPHRLTFPVFVKSRDRSESYREANLPEQDARYCEDAATLQRMVQQSARPQNLLVQERVSGDDVGLAVLMSGGDVLCSFQYRARKMQPAEGGVCVLARSETVNTIFLNCAVRLLRSLEWDGIAQIDFRHDPRTGKFALLEVNGRFWGSTAAALVAGIDFPYYAWQLGQGITPKCAVYRTGVLVRWLEGDFRRLLDLAGARPTEGRSFARELFHFLVDFRPSVRGMFWSWRDPIAGIDMTRLLARWWIAARWNRARLSADNTATEPTPIARIVSLPETETRNRAAASESRTDRDGIHISTTNGTV